jgi:hypothetical protein
LIQCGDGFSVARYGASLSPSNDALKAQLAGMIEQNAAVSLKVIDIQNATLPSSDHLLKAPLSFKRWKIAEVFTVQERDRMQKDDSQQYVGRTQARVGLGLRGRVRLSEFLTYSET